MSHATKSQTDVPESGEIDREVLEFRAQFEGRSALDEIVRNGACQMLQAAIEQEVQDFLAAHSDRRDEAGRRLVVRNGHLPAREIATGAGMLKVQQPRVRDNSPDHEQRVRFTPSVLPAYLRRSKSIDELIPWLYCQWRSKREPLAGDQWPQFAMSRWRSDRDQYRAVGDGVRWECQSSLKMGVAWNRPPCKRRLEVE